MFDAQSTVTDEIHSRSALAGYRPEILHDAAVLIVGAGALGQNVAQNLALSGVGHLMVVDFDIFEPHNATRSPFFPRPEDEQRHQGRKAPIVASRCREVATAPRPDVRWATSLIQLLGDAPIAWADVVVSAVDSVSARAWLAERCRLHGTPMAEGGFSGPAFNFSLFSGRTGRACYRCHNPRRESSASCTRYALLAESLDRVPAIQTTAAVLAGLMSEQVIQLLHGAEPGADERYYGNVRDMDLRQVVLQTNAKCPGDHEPLGVLGTLDGVDADSRLADLSEPIMRLAGPGDIVLAEPVHLSFACTRCSRMCAVNATDSLWLVDSRCESCGGPWQLSSSATPMSVRTISVPDDLAEETPLAELTLAAVGIRPGSSLVYNSPKGLLLLPGDIDFVSESCRGPGKIEN